jgi:hypothetical protein
MRSASVACCARAGLAATALVAALAAAGCGGSGSRPVTNGDGIVTFPNLGYKPRAPRLAASAAGSALVVGLTNAAAVRPARMQLASDAAASDLRWSRWGAATATAHGTVTVRICSPNCGGGSDRRYPATLTLSGIHRCRGHGFYERASLSLATVQGRRPWGAYVKTPCSGKE